MEELKQCLFIALAAGHYLLEAKDINLSSSSEDENGEMLLAAFSFLVPNAVQDRLLIWMYFIVFECGFQEELQSYSSHIWLTSSVFKRWQLPLIMVGSTRCQS